MSYNGRRLSHSGSSSGGCSAGGRVARLLFFPLLFPYLELVLHLHMKMSLAYLPIWLLFGMAGGLVLTALTIPFSKTVNHILSAVLAWLISLIFVVEMIAKKILQSYYPLSTLGTAADNKLTDYADVIAAAVGKSALIIVVFFLPALLLTVFGRRVLGFERYDCRLSGVLVVGAILFHLVGLGMVHLPWGGDLTPKQLYRVDTNADDQVEQLGLLNMFRLDVKHMIVPAKGNLDSDFSTIGGLGDDSSSEDSSGDISEEPGPVIDTSPNVMDVDLNALAEGTSNKDIQWLCNYFNSVTPTKKNEYTGMFEGYNVIFFTLEGFSGYVIDPELTPTLYKLTHEGFVFNNFYTALHYTSTSNGECQNLLGLYPKNGNPITMKRTGVLGTDCYFSLAQQLGRLGYQTLGYHNNGDMYGRAASHSNLGYDWKYYKHGLDCEMNSAGTEKLWPQRDSYMIEASVDDYINSDQPFHVYYLTISGHTPYSWNWVARQYKDQVSSLPYSEKTQAYIATAMEVDKALETLIQKLDEAGKLDKTLIVAAPDHVPYFDIDTLEELSGEKFGKSEDMEGLKESAINFDVYKNSLIIWSASMTEPVNVDKVTCQVDILPTVSNLLGLEYDSRMLAGSDALSDSEGLVVFTSRCWKSDKGFYNRFTQTFTPAAGVTMTQEEQDSYVSAMKKLVDYKLESTARIVENNFYHYAFAKK